MLTILLFLVGCGYTNTPGCRRDADCDGRWDYEWQPIESPAAYQDWNCYVDITGGDYDKVCLPPLKPEADAPSCD